MAQIALPNGNSGTTSWVQANGDGDGDWWDELDEGVASADGDTTAWRSMATPNNAPIAVTLTPVSDPGIHTGHIIRCAWRKSGTGGMVISGTLELYEGETLIATATDTDVAENSYQVFSYTLSEGEAANITDYSALGLVVIANNSGGSPARTLVLSALELEVPDAASNGIEGELAATLAPATLAATGELLIEGQVAVTLAAATVTAEATLALTGQAEIVLDDAQLAAEGSLALLGTLERTLEPASLDATGLLALMGVLDATLEAATLEAMGTQGGLTGSLAVTLDDATLNAAGSLMLSGSLSSTLDLATLNADGSLGLSGALLATLDPAILNADGTLNLTAALSATLDPAVLTADGRLAIVGQLAATLADAVLVATGSGPVLVVVEGAVRSPGRAASIQSPPNTSIIYSEVGHV